VNETFDSATDTGSKVTQEYSDDFTFSGTIRKATIEYPIGDVNPEIPCVI